MSDHEDQFLVFAADDTNRLTEEHGHGEMGRDKAGVDEECRHEEDKDESNTENLKNTGENATACNGINRKNYIERNRIGNSEIEEKIEKQMSVEKNISIEQFFGENQKSTRNSDQNAKNHEEDPESDDEETAYLNLIRSFKKEESMHDLKNASGKLPSSNCEDEISIDEFHDSESNGKCSEEEDEDESYLIQLKYFGGSGKPLEQGQEKPTSAETNEGFNIDEKPDEMKNNYETDSVENVQKGETEEEKRKRLSEEERLSAEFLASLDQKTIDADRLRHNLNHREKIKEEAERQQLEPEMQKSYNNDYRQSSINSHQDKYENSSNGINYTDRNQDVYNNKSYGQQEWLKNTSSDHLPYCDPRDIQRASSQNVYHEGINSHVSRPNYNQPQHHQHHQQSHDQNSTISSVEYNQYQQKAGSYGRNYHPYNNHHQQYNPYNQVLENSSSEYNPRQQESRNASYINISTFDGYNHHQYNGHHERANSYNPYPENSRNFSHQSQHSGRQAEQPYNSYDQFLTNGRTESYGNTNHQSESLEKSNYDYRNTTILRLLIDKKTESYEIARQIIDYLELCKRKNVRVTKDSIYEAPNRVSYNVDLVVFINQKMSHLVKCEDDEFRLILNSDEGN
ncbi:Non-specific serine/threonine protein kinase [Caenorhabditis elegans]|uniref:Non-specific serine/threonine protein kinase n=1 Tax=Caenorhabditis elegans TaxID=6239 RepID=Q93321_CAEEL|nr:Non-specific serine/threonine protein kinase [Caenorhabditis elegans]CAB01734.2 Non-specific serine/threonine protein kinase [Caenorhabditis elegans]|eukprot:NP_510344.2 Uncharacterized protein CELE_C33G3.6 [Caenorhabditis elegans]